jgi:hypothetical protein
MVATSNACAKHIGIKRIPSDVKVNLVIYDLFVVLIRAPRRSCISANAAIVVSELVFIFDDTGVELDDVGIL